MNRRLIIMRHAKSSWTSPASSDHQRPLNARGRRAAPLVADQLVQLGWTPQFVLSSDSQRTRETWQMMAERLGTDTPVDFTSDAYLAAPETLRQVLRRLDDQVEIAMLLGHNPGCELLVSELVRAEHYLKTADAALLYAPPGDWFEVLVASGAWQLERIIRARELETEVA